MPVSVTEKCRSACRRRWRDPSRASPTTTSPALGELDGVADQVDEHLPQPARVADDTGRARPGRCGRPVPAPCSCARTRERLAASAERVAQGGTSIASSSSLPASILEKSRMSLRIASSDSADRWTMVEILALLRPSAACPGRSSVMPMMPFIGVRISWLMLARNSLLARLASIALSRALIRSALAARSSAVRVDGVLEIACWAAARRRAAGSAIISLKPSISSPSSSSPLPFRRDVVAVSWLTARVAAVVEAQGAASKSRAGTATRARSDSPHGVRGAPAPPSTPDTPSPGPHRLDDRSSSNRDRAHDLRRPAPPGATRSSDARPCSACHRRARLRPRSASMPCRREAAPSACRAVGTRASSDPVPPSARSRAATMSSLAAAAPRTDLRPPRWRRRTVSAPGGAVRADDVGQEHLVSPDQACARALDDVERRRWPPRPRRCGIRARADADGRQLPAQREVASRHGRPEEADAAVSVMPRHAPPRRTAGAAHPFA